MATPCKQGLTYPLLEIPQLGHRQRIRLANDGNHVHARREPAHEFNVDFAEAAEAGKGGRVRGHGFEKGQGRGAYA